MIKELKRLKKRIKNKAFYIPKKKNSVKKAIKLHKKYKKNSVAMIQYSPKIQNKQKRIKKRWVKLHSTKIRLQKFKSLYKALLY